ncbi:MAG: hypothetical protein N3G20_09585 [Verrucomicrobiae bacterium]|nr:hypothetical protein [Verrucomicrobiae bacterium]
MDSCTRRTAVQLMSFGLLIAAAGTAYPKANSPGIALGPLYQRFDLLLDKGTREEGLGPFWYREERREPLDHDQPGAGAGSVTEKTFAIPPLFSIQERPQTEGRSWDFIYPVITYDRYGQERFFQALQLLSFSAGQNADGVTWEKFSFFPIYFQCRASDPSLNYTAVWPIYGRVEKRFFRDEVEWVLWPAYVRTRKRDVVTENFFVPLVHVRRGPGLTGWQLWPVIGKESREVLCRTNTAGLCEVDPGHELFFMFWPVYTRAELMLGTTNPVRQLAVLPLFSSRVSPASDTKTYLWPFGVTLSHDRSQRYRQFDLAWPLISFGRGPSRKLDRLFPVVSRDHKENSESLLLLWPLYRQRTTVSEAVRQTKVQILLGVYTDETLKDEQTGKSTSRTDLWPLFVTRRDFDGRERFQMLAFLEPFLPRNDGVVRNYSPIWSIWRSETDKRAGKQSQSFLWNLYRCDRTPTARKFSLMFGLVQHYSGPDGSGWRWFHLFGRRPSPGSPSQSVRERRTPE